jgi:pre-mRNA-splicing factor SYF2
VVEEDRVSKLPRNYEARRRREEWELQELKARREAEEKGEDYDRIKALNVQADKVDRQETAKRRRFKTKDAGFASG